MTWELIGKLVIGIVILIYGIIYWSIRKDLAQPPDEAHGFTDLEVDK